MTPSRITIDSLLTIDVGAITTQAMLFDVVDGSYRFLAVGTAPTTAGAPFNNISEGVRMAIDQLQSISGRPLIGLDEQLIMPSPGDGTGVDAFSATVSAGSPIKIVAVGLLENVSLESARRLAVTTYGKVIQAISLNDRRRLDTRVDAIVRSRPDLIIVAGGTDNGASQSVIRSLDAVGLACYLMPENQRPEVLFVGNQALRDNIQAVLEGVANLHFAPNIRPTLDVEQLDAAQSKVTQMFRDIRSQQMLGISELNTWAGGGLLPTSTAFGRVIRFLSSVRETEKGVFGVDVGASATTIAAAFRGDLALNVFPQFGIGRGLGELLDHISLDDITRWLTLNVSDDNIREYLATKSLYPASLPMTPDDLAIEQAIARQLMRSAVKLSVAGFPVQDGFPGDDLLPWVEPIMATGSMLTRSPSLAHTALMLLDGLQPTGVTTLVLDQNHIAAAIGAAAAINPLLSVQVLDSNAFLRLGTVVTPVGYARPGTPVLRAKITYASGQETSIEVKQGALEMLPLPRGKSARLQLQPLHRYNIGMGSPGRGGSLNVKGGALGVIIDARGRPLSLPKDRGARFSLFDKWLRTLGGQ